MNLLCVYVYVAKMAFPCHCWFHAEDVTEIAEDQDEVVTWRDEGVEDVPKISPENRSSSSY